MDKKLFIEKIFPIFVIFITALALVMMVVFVSFDYIDSYQVKTIVTKQGGKIITDKAGEEVIINKGSLLTQQIIDSVTPPEDTKSLLTQQIIDSVTPPEGTKSLLTQQMIDSVTPPR